MQNWRLGQFLSRPGEKWFSDSINSLESRNVKNGAVAKYLELLYYTW